MPGVAVESRNDVKSVLLLDKISRLHSAGKYNELALVLDEFFSKEYSLADLPKYYITLFTNALGALNLAFLVKEKVDYKLSANAAKGLLLNLRYISDFPVLASTLSPNTFLNKCATVNGSLNKEILILCILQLKKILEDTHTTTQISEILFNKSLT